MLTVDSCFFRNPVAVFMLVDAILSLSSFCSYFCFDAFKFEVFMLIEYIPCMCMFVQWTWFWLLKYVNYSFYLTSLVVHVIKWCKVKAIILHSVHLKEMVNSAQMELWSHACISLKSDYTSSVEWQPDLTAVRHPIKRRGNWCIYPIMCITVYDNQCCIK